MRRIQLDVWEPEDCIKCINDVSNQIRGLKKHQERINPEKILTALDNIREVLLYWTGNTYVGCPKDEKTEKVFNDFFKELYSFIWLVIYDTRFPNKMRASFHDKALYQGKAYRLLGLSGERYSVSKDKSKYIEPIYNDIYVSWNKESENDCLSGKLYGPITKIECDISGDYYGIDLDYFGVCRGEEKEVVFPTVKDTITNIEYLRIEDYE